MGEEIHEVNFRARDYQVFQKHLQAETTYLESLFLESGFSKHQEVGGFELESWLITPQGLPAPENERYLKVLDDPLAVPELARFNVEVNSAPRNLCNTAFSQMREELQNTWSRCSQVARNMDLDMVMIGILPTVRDEDLTLDNMSQMTRYRALNEQVLLHRRGHPLRFNIQGHEHLAVEHHDVMLESAATSFQIHIQVPLSRARRYYNSAIALSAPMVAATANAPYLFGKDLWAETRIPLFEQAVEVGGAGGAAFGPVRRVTFGSDYARHSIMECFTENLQHYPILLPIDFATPVEQLRHVRLHNGTIWRWNRPLIGFDDDGTPHLRIEHRVVPSGPSIEDAIANTALFFGMASHYANCELPLEELIDFSHAKDNFYNAARYGLQAQLFIGNRHVSAERLLLDDLLPNAHRGLQRLDVDLQEIDHYLGIIEARLRSGQTGSVWQRAFVARHGTDMQALTLAYLERQNSGQPVHEWTI